MSCCSRGQRHEGIEQRWEGGVGRVDGWRISVRTCSPWSWHRRPSLRPFPIVLAVTEMRRHRQYRPSSGASTAPRLPITPNLCPTLSEQEFGVRQLFVAQQASEFLRRRIFNSLIAMKYRWCKRWKKFEIGSLFCDVTFTCISCWFKIIRNLISTTLFYLTADPGGPGICAFILTLFSFLLILATFPLSLCFSVKVT